MSAYSRITDHIIKLLKAGTVPWHKPWVQTGLPVNYVSKRPYSGLNVFMLASANFPSRYWLTFNQAADLGAKVKKGSKSTPVTFWKIRDTEDEASGEKKSFPLLRYYNLFNLSQIEDGVLPDPDATNRPVRMNPIPAANKIILEMPNRPEIAYEHQSAYYDRRRDVVNLPDPTDFDTPADYYSTAFHELAHATGHKTRLGRHDAKAPVRFGSKRYSQEELVAEMAAAFLCGTAGIVTDTIESSAAYISHWLRKLQEDSRFIIKTAGLAQKAHNYIVPVPESEG